MAERMKTFFEKVEDYPLIDRLKDMPVYSIGIDSPTDSDREYYSTLDHIEKIVEKYLGDDYAFMEPFVRQNDNYIRVVVCRWSDYSARCENRG